MSNACIRPLFSLEDNSLDFLQETIKNSTVDNVSSNIASLLKEQASFATVESDVESENYENYEDNIIETLIPSLVNKINSVWRVQLLPRTQQKIINQLRNEFIPKDKQLVKKEVPQTETSEDKANKQNLSLRQLRNLLFKGEPLLSEFHLKRFKQEIKEKTIYDSSSNNRKLVYDIKTLNQNLKQYKQELYETIYDFCKKNNITSEKIRSYYSKDNVVRGDDVLDDFFRYIQSLDANERLTELEKNWSDEITGQKDGVTLLDAVNAYISLVKFDDLIKDTVGKYISINFKLDEPINTIIANNRKEIQYKYSFGRRKTNMQKDFRDVMQSALDTMGNFSKFLIESIPRINSTENITQIQFLNSLIHLRQAISQLASNDTNIKKFKDPIGYIHSNPKESWKTILDNFANLSSYSNFIESGLTLEDIEVINSIQRFLYGKTEKEKKNSIYALEQQVHDEVGYKEIYSISETLLGAIDSTSDLTYLETKWNYEEEQPEVGIKKKYFNDKQRLDLIKGINQESTKELSINKKSEYKISYLSGPFTFQILDLPIEVQSKRSSEWGIFDSNVDVNITTDDSSIDQYFKSINLNGPKNREDILNATKGKEKQFLELLQFIDGALNTGLSINAEGLQRFFIYRTKHKNALKDLVIAASRVYLVKDLNRKFKESIKNEEINPETNFPYTELDIKTWLKYNKSQVPVVQFTRELNDDNKKYFKNIAGITYLNPVGFESDTWIRDLGDAQTILLGESLKATTKDFNRNNVPNYSPAYLGAEINEILRRDSQNSVTKNLLFSTRSDTIKGVVIDTDVKIRNGKHKAVSDMTEAELQYHFFVNKFLIPFKEGLFYAQPTVYSDKKKFVNYVVSLTDLKVNDKSNSEIIDLIQNTIGTYYHDVFNNVLEDYVKLFGTNNIKEINQRLHELSLEELLNLVTEYNKKYPESRVELIQDLHYRNVNGKLGLNETLYYYHTELYTPRLEEYLHEESINYVNSLLNSGVIFDTKSGFLSGLNEVAKSIKVSTKEWISGNNLILAKIHNLDGTVTNVVAGEMIDPELNIEVNPILERYVLMHNLINNNLKEALIGTDSIHKIKIKSPEIYQEYENILGDHIDLSTADLVDLQIAIQEVESEIVQKAEREVLSQEDSMRLNRVNNIKNLILDEVRTLQSNAENAQLKRTVAVPGTMRYYLQGTLTGIVPTLRAAIIQDIHASVFNLEGSVKDDLEAHDGGAYLNPVTALLQNYSLQDSEVGDIIKPLWDVSVPKYGSKRLVKYAAHTMTNAVMRNSELSEISMHRMFRKMTNISWNGEYNTIEKNLFNQYHHRSDDRNVHFVDIIQNSGNLYYEQNGLTYQITNFAYDENGYYTKEQEVFINPSNKKVTQVAGTSVKYYHYFDKNGTHYKIREGESIPEGTHTIDSIYELHTTLGGIYSKTYSDGQFVYGNGSTLATTAIINMVSQPTQKYYDTVNKENVMNSQEYFYQPLKYKMIDYLINQSAIKNGSANINFREIYQNPENELNDITDDSPLRYIEMDTQRYGIQQDSEHEADEEELTEMSQVISAIDAGGNYHQEVTELYKAIGNLALTAARVEISKIKAFMKDQTNQNILYDLVGRTLIQHMAFNRGQNGLAENLIDNIRKTFSLSSEHEQDLIKIPFSDQTVYSQVISTIASILNKKSVKRKFPGTGQVMVPGYNIVQLWEIDGKTARFEDLLKEAKESGIKIEETSDLSQNNKTLVRAYLQSKQEEYARENTKRIIIDETATYDEEFWKEQLQHIEPNDVIQITVNGNTVLKPIKLNKIEDYYKFKHDPLQYLSYLNIPILTLDVVKRIDIPKDLSPLKFSFTYLDENGIEHTRNIYDHWAVEDMYFDLERYKNFIDTLGLTKYERDKRIELKKIELRKQEQEALNLLENENKYKDRLGNTYDVISTTSTEAQTLMSNIYKSKFEMKDGESLYDILKQGPSRFKVNPLSLLPKESIYDLAFMKTNGEGVLISFDDNMIEELSGYYKVKDKQFKNINKHYLVERNGEIYDDTTGERMDNSSLIKKTKTLDGRTIASYVYMLDNNNSEIIPIGIEVDVSNEIEYDGTEYVNKTTKQKVTNRTFTEKDGKILEFIQFVEKKEVKPKHAERYSVYNIKHQLLSKLLGSSKEIIKQLYDQDSYGYILPARHINPNNIKALQSSLNYLEKQIMDSSTVKYLKELQKGINYSSKTQIIEGSLIPIKGYAKYFAEYNDILAERVFNSFKESLNFISSRIPAQSLQSFMKMKVVGFTQSGANQAYVSHWQTWLQGSDYDIDKSYMLGNEIDDNGIYQGWSSLFDHSNIEASKKLPFPTGISVRTAEKNETGFSIEQFVARYKLIPEDDNNEKLNLYNDLIRYINTLPISESGEILISWTEDEDQSIRSKLVEIVRKHNTTTFNLDKAESGLKNFISNKLQKIIQGTKNLIGSHAPVTLDDLHSAADSSSIRTQVWTTMNPGYIPLMQTQAMVGKKGVGIAANGQKAGFIWKYWMTDSINENNQYKEFVNFPQGFHIDRIEGRFGGEIEDREIRRLPDINMYNASEKDKLYYEYNENHYVPSDQMSSQMISAATDNAKELILDRINANTDLSKMYMYLITLGFDVKDIVSFMTSPFINFIARNSTNNIFLDTNYRVEDVANLIINSLNKKLGLTVTPAKIPSIPQKYKFALDIKINNLVNDIENNLKEGETLNDKLTEIIQDVQEFKKIYKLSQEFSNLGRLLGINQGIPTSKEDLMSFKKFLFDIISQRELEAGLITRKKGRYEKNDKTIESLPEDLVDLVNNFDANEFLNSSEYRYRVIRYYELIKGSVNVFAVVESAPQFKTILDIANVLNTIDMYGIAKSKAVDNVYNRILQLYPFATVDYAKQLLPITNQILIEDYIENNPIEIPISKDWNYIDNNWKLQKFAEDGTLRVGSNDYGLNINSSISSFHYIMDEYIIPKLKSGEFELNGKTLDLKNNAFIQNLVTTIDGNMIKYKLNLDMRAIRNNPESRVILNNILKGMKELQNYKIGNSSTNGKEKNLLDIFMAYSLVVDQNQIGSDRMTDLFATFVNEYQIDDNLLLDYFKYIGEIDFNDSSFINKVKNYSVNDFLIALSLPVSDIAGHNEPSIKYYNEDGLLSFMYSIGFNQYIDFGDLLPIQFGENKSEKLIRQARREKYGFGLFYNNSIVDLIANLKNTDKVDNWIDTMNMVVSNGYIKIKIDCK